MKKIFKKPFSVKKLFVNLIIFGLALTVLSLATFLIWVSTLQIPDLSAFGDREILQSTKIYDRTGEVLLFDLHSDVRRTVVPFENISIYLKNATIAIEDDRFYEHKGIEPKAILRAVFTNFLQGELLSGQGGSTLTQQIIKNSILQREKTVSRKVKEWILAIKLEQEYTKDEILSIYLNESPYGGTIYGVEEAAQSFFGKNASNVTLAEAAYLAALPQSPTRLSPYGNNKDLLDQRQRQVLDRMLINDFIDQEEHREAVNEEVEFITQTISNIKAPHFVMYIREILAQKFGEETLAKGGLKVITSLDWDLQNKAEEIVKKHGATNVEKFNATNASLVATDPKTGDILAMVGSRDYFSEEIDGNFNAALGLRQPGSSIKPFIYAAAFSKGYLPNTVVYDVKTQFSPLCPKDSWSSESPCYSPNNYNGSFIGPVNLRNSLAQSLNIPAVKVLYLAGIKYSMELANKMGITTLNNPDRLGLTLVLGGGEVRLLDITSAYGVFANKGIKAEPRSIIRIENSQGSIIEENNIETSRVLDENVTNMISDVLSDDVARTPLWGANSLVNFVDRSVASKTGSTNDFKDAWMMGYSPNISVGIWAGNNTPSSMKGLSGLIVAPMWREFFDYALAKLPDERFTKPEINLNGLKPILRGEYLNMGIIQQMLLEGEELDISRIYEDMHTILYFVDRDNPQGPMPTNPYSQDQAFENWEYGVQVWKKQTYGF